MATKQVIVVRTDLKMRRGKEDAQVAHAAMAWLVHIMKSSWHFNGTDEWYETMTKPEIEWLTGCFTKIVVSVDSVEELNRIAQEAENANLRVERIIDAGRTEFGGVPTFTCIAIGPDEEDKIDKITGNLKLR